VVGTCLAVAAALWWRPACALDVPKSNGELTVPSIPPPNQPADGPVAVASVDSLDELLKLAQSLQPPFRAVTDAQRQAARQAAVAAADRFERQLSGNPQQAPGWKAYLFWPVLRILLAPETKPNPDDLASLSEHYLATLLPLDLREYHAFGRALRELAHALRRYERVVRPPGEAEYQQQLAALRAALGSIAQQRQAEAFQKLSQALTWLEDYRQAPELTAAVRKVLWRPNFHIEIRADIVTAGFNQRIENEVRPITECIDGTWVTGTGRTFGDIAARLVPSDAAGSIENIFEGLTYSRTTGMRGNITVYSRGVAEFQAVKPLFIDPLGFRTGPTTASADVSTTTEDVDSGCDVPLLGSLADRIAWNQVEKRRGRSEYIASRRAEQRIEEQMDSGAAQRLDQSNRDYVQKVRGPLLARDAFPKFLNLRTTRDALIAVGLHAKGVQLAAPDPPVERAGNHGLAVRVHETTVNNLASDLLSNRTLREDELKRLTNGNSGLVEISFASDPVTFDVGEGVVSIVIRATEFVTKEERFPYAMNMSAVYQIVRDQRGVRAVRQGDVEVLPPDFKPGDMISGKRLALRGQLIEELDRTLLKKELPADDLELPGRWKVVGKLRLIELTATRDWLRLGWEKLSQLERPSP
jgi:hypothetical protein